MTVDEIALKLTPSRVVSASDPGHVSVVYLDGADELTFRGFRFNVTDLPAEFQDAARWREYLFEHCVPGYVVDDILHKRRFAEHKALFRCGKWPVADAAALEALRELPVPSRQGFYSFNPDDFENCNNCVTWACSIVQGVAGAVVVERPSQGRIKLLAEQLHPTVIE